MVRSRRRALTAVVAGFAGVVFVLAVPASATGSAVTDPVAPITVLVTNDDGVRAPGIDALARALRALPEVEVVVVAPATDQSGVGGLRTSRPLTGDATKTVSGDAASAVFGTPADSVDYALDVLGIHPTVTVSGINRGQNLGPSVDRSGTVGAARRSAARGVPALAVSAQHPGADYRLARKLAAAWVSEHRSELVRSSGPASVRRQVTNLNVPTCPGSRIRGVYETVPASPDSAPTVARPVDCVSTATTYRDDVAAYNDGWATMTLLPIAASG